MPVALSIRLPPRLADIFAAYYCRHFHYAGTVCASAADAVYFDAMPLLYYAAYAASFR